MPDLLTRVDEGGMVSACCGAETYFTHDAGVICKQCDLFTARVRTVVNRADLQRLQSAVVKAAIAWNGTNHRNADECERALVVLGDACDALIAFEAEHKIGE